MDENERTTDELVREPKRRAGTRGMGSVYRLKGRETWWVKFYHRGRCFRESSGSTVKKVATSLLKKRLSETGAGQFNSAAERTTFEDLAKMLKDDYATNGRRSWNRCASSVKRLRAFFGHYKVADITYATANAYVAQRLAAEAARG